MYILKFPLSKITFTFLAGILYAFYLEPKPEIVFLFLIIIYFCLFICFYLAKKDFIQKSYFGIFTYLLCFWIGNTAQIIHMNPYQKTHYIHQIKDNRNKNLIELTIIEKLKNGGFNQRYIARIKHSNYDYIKKEITLIINDLQTL